MPEEFERSDKIPLSVDSMLFKLLNRKACRVSHRGVLEFTAEEGMIYMPYWMMKNMHLQEGDRVIVESVTLSKGTHSKFQPHTGDFFDIPDSNDLLGTILRNFSCLTTGDRIMVTYEEQKYYIDIVKSKPANAISIIETRTDCKVRYASPLYPKEPEKPIASRSAGKAPEAEEDHLQFTDRGIKYTLDSEIANKLFPHQLEAINWLWHLHCLEGGGGILADGMGLGKTYTVCSFISILLNCNLINRILMISPPTLLTHWTNELAGVGLSSYITSYHSVSTACRPQLLEDFMDRDKGILVTTYGIATKDIEIIKGAGSEVKWDYLIIDEGQFIKNDETNRWRSLNGLQTFHRLIITGTPIQNNLKELWALLDFCTKQAVGTYKEFKQHYESPMIRAVYKFASEEAKRDRDDVTEEFKDFIRPYILRRSESLISRHDEKNHQKTRIGSMASVD